MKTALLHLYHILEDRLQLASSQIKSYRSKEISKAKTGTRQQSDSGITGVAGQLRYNTDTGRLTEATAFDKEEEVIF
jgi:hypothetical protein